MKNKSRTFAFGLSGALRRLADRRHTLLYIRAMNTSNIRPALLAYLEGELLLRYDAFDAAHRRDHALAVAERSMDLAAHYDVDAEMVLTVAYYHDLGLSEGREHHHEVSAQLLLADECLRCWFSGEQLEVMAEAVADHRASAKHAPRSIYGSIVAEADRLIDPMLVLRRTVQYGLAHYPELSREQHYERFLHHLQEKYAEGGYLRLWLPESANAAPLAELRRIIADNERLRRQFESLYEAEAGK